MKESTVRIGLLRRQFIPGPRGSDRQRMLYEVGDLRVDDEVAPSCSLLDSTVDTGRQRPDKYDGAKPLTALNTSRHKLNWVKDVTVW